MRTSPTDRQAGFTLVELLAVLVILALSATAILSLGRNSLESARVRSFMIQAEAMLRDARTAAIEGQTETSVLIDEDGRSISFPARDRVLRLPAGLALDAKVAKAAGAESPGVRFFPSGSSTGGVLSFQFRGRAYALRINWLTGRADAETL
ncbi:GspH/FimT family pseudopilin [Aestuariivirga sp.]|uniref:GspH/FimT family pseudopilin n=1 Tax=Aestuariivirga sp. TaxID=2650926 RepID=UPI003BACB6FA